MYIKRFYSQHLKNYSISNILQNINVNNKAGAINMQGWIKSSRKMKEHSFFDINDGSSSKNLQVVVPKSLVTNELTVGAAISVNGQLNITSKGQQELLVDDVNVYGKCDVTDGYPFRPKKTYTSEYTRQQLHFRPRTNTFSSLLRVRSRATQAIHNFFEANNYLHVHTPILTSNDCEGAGETFQVLPDNEETLQKMISGDSTKNVPLNEVYFNSKAFLTVSGQLHLEALAHSLNKVYTFGPTFRAENSKSRLHLSEFYMLESECAFVNDLETMLQFVEDLLKETTLVILNDCSEDASICREEQFDHKKWLQNKFYVMTYDEASKVLEDNEGKYKYRFKKFEGLIKEHEHFLVEYCGGIPVFIINWPKEMKPFYARESKNDKSKVSAFDLLVPNVGELVGGSLRENNYEILQSKLPQGRADLSWYLDLRKFGNASTAGFGLGFERYLQFLLGINNIKDVIPFPRWPHNCRL